MNIEPNIESKLEIELSGLLDVFVTILINIIKASSCNQPRQYNIAI